MSAEQHHPVPVDPDPTSHRQRLLTTVGRNAEPRPADGNPASAWANPPGPTIAETVGSDRSIADQIAKLVFTGHVVHAGSLGDFTVCKYALSRYCQNFAELQAFAKKLGVQ